MGADLSALQIPLVPQQVPICAVDPRFCLTRTVQLRIPYKIWPLSLSSADIQITDPSDGTVYFRCNGKAFSLQGKKTLLDNMGIVVLNMKEELMSCTEAFTIYAGNSSWKMICKITTELNFAKPKLYAQFKDVVTGEHRCLVLKGDLSSKVCMIYVGEPKLGGPPIAKIFRPLNCYGSNDYNIEIAPGVDISLIVMMCVALEEYM